MLETSGGKKMLNIKSRAKIKYYVGGTRPHLLIITGMHGDEFKAVKCVEQAVKKYLNKLPPFVFIPKASPSAVRQRTRFNQEKIDLNRNFFDDTQSSEVKIIMNIVKKYKFDLCVSFHEDPEQEEFYCYDSGEGQNCFKIKGFQQVVCAYGFKLFNGIDDRSDPALGYQFIDGYIGMPPDFYLQNNGTFENWAIRRGIIKRILTLEIPGKLPKNKKQQLVELFFGHVILDGN